MQTEALLLPPPPKPPVILEALEPPEDHEPGPWYANRVAGQKGLWLSRFPQPNGDFHRIFLGPEALTLAKAYIAHGFYAP